MVITFVPIYVRFIIKYCLTPYQSGAGTNGDTLVYQATCRWVAEFQPFVILGGVPTHLVLESSIVVVVCAFGTTATAGVAQVYSTGGAVLVELFAH